MVLNQFLLVSMLQLQIPEELNKMLTTRADVITSYNCQMQTNVPQGKASTEATTAPGKTSVEEMDLLIKAYLHRWTTFSKA